MVCSVILPESHRQLCILSITRESSPTPRLFLRGTGQRPSSPARQNFVALTTPTATPQSRQHAQIEVDSSFAGCQNVWELSFHQCLKRFLWGSSVKCPLLSQAQFYSFCSCQSLWEGCLAETVLVSEHIVSHASLCDPFINCLWRLNLSKAFQASLFSSYIS